jgi:hypothetical protein
MRKSVLTSLCVSNTTNEASTITADSSMRSPPAKKANMTILVIDVLVLLSTSLLKNILPEPIIINFPHTHIQLGSKLGNPSCPRSFVASLTRPPCSGRATSILLQPLPSNTPLCCEDFCPQGLQSYCFVRDCTAQGRIDHNGADSWVQIPSPLFDNRWCPDKPTH